MAQTLEFHRTAPSYCEPVTPGKAVPYTATAKDNVSGTWQNSNGEVFDLSANLQTGVVTGKFTDKDGNQYEVGGLFDTIAPGSSQGVAAQGVTLSLYDSSKNLLKAVAGGIDYSDLSQMWLWTSDLQSTNWTDRFIQETLDKTIFKKSSE